MLVNILALLFSLKLMMGLDYDKDINNNPLEVDSIGAPHATDSSDSEEIPLIDLFKGIINCRIF